MPASALMNVMIAAARKAARSLARDFGEVEQLQVSLKGPANFVSAADHRAEEILFTELSRARPGYGFLMEERGEVEGADRTQAIASLDGAGPKWMGKFTNFGTPIAVNIASGVVGSLFVLVVFLVTKGQLENFFSVMLSLAISTTSVSYFFILPALVRLRKLYPSTDRPYRVPGGTAGVWIATIITEAS